MREQTYVEIDGIFIQRFRVTAILPGPDSGATLHLEGSPSVVVKATPAEVRRLISPDDERETSTPVADAQEQPPAKCYDSSRPPDPVLNPLHLNSESV